MSPKVDDATGAFVAGPAVVWPGAPTGPLAGLTFAAKDLFDVQGHVTGCGNPDWARTHAPARRHAWAVARLLAAGATLVGKTVTDEISLGLLGINRFHGTPLNPRAPDRVPGGSSSGSASAVASGLVDFSLGTDSGGSVRIPASFTGLFGLRPTHGAIPVDGLMTQALSFDTVGFFAADAGLFERVGQVLLPASASVASGGRLGVATDAFALADPQVRQALTNAVARVAGHLSSLEDVTLAPEGLPLWCSNQRTLQAFEFGRTFRDWVERCNPTFSYEVASSLVHGASIAESEMAGPRACRAMVRSRLATLLDGHRWLCLPTAPILPIRRSASLTEMRAAVDRIVHLTCIAGLAGCPQMNLPMGSSDGIPVGLSVIGPPGSDLQLLALAKSVMTEQT